MLGNHYHQRRFGNRLARPQDSLPVSVGKVTFADHDRRRSSLDLLLHFFNPRAPTYLGNWLRFEHLPNDAFVFPTGRNQKD
jgi:hypothetical protein